MTSNRGIGRAYIVPQRQILEPKDMARWQQSSTYKEVVSFVEQLSKSVEGKPVSSDYVVSANVQAVCVLLDKAERLIERHPPDRSTASRYGNKAFRGWISDLEKQAGELLLDMLAEKYHGAIFELAPYLEQAFGNATRIDYGSGHELSFMMWVLCLCKLGFLEPSDSTAIVLAVFRRYILLCQRLQETYSLEPAGSHGVWGLDDYQFLLFYFGSAQLIGSDLAPAASVDMQVVSDMAFDYLYLQGIR
ncbi:Serine/threonine-protein phosphatase 2A activator 2, partial [Coemansia sp. RSA 1285]